MIHKTIILLLVMTAVLLGVMGCHGGGLGRGYPGGGCANSHFHAY